MRVRRCLALTLFCFLAVDATCLAASPFTYKQVMIPVRDGARLQTVILAPVDQKGPLPILLRRTPYGVPAEAPETTPASIRELAADGYIFVIQNLRGRFKSDGVFTESQRVDLSDPKSVSETTDAYDTIDWLIKNVPNNNGRVGIFGVSYDGLTAGMTLLQPHPALKAVSEQASPVDQWMNDDDHRYGALRESYAFEYAVYEEADKNANTHFNFDRYDTYEWYLALGPLANIEKQYAKGKLPSWTLTIEHPDYDDFWEKEAWVHQLHSSTVPNLNVAGFWDQEDPWGPWQIYRHAAESDPSHTNLMVAGPWFHGQWAGDDGAALGQLSFSGHKTGLEFREQIEAPFFRYWLHGEGEKPAWAARIFETGSNTWRTYDTWPVKGSTATSLYLHSDGTLSLTPPAAAEAKYREYVSDPASPVPYRQRPISPTYPAGDWRRWEAADQRFVDGRPDVLTYTSAPLDHDLRVTGEVAADLYASTSGTDSDFVVKLIDVYPEDAQPNAWKTDAGPAPGEYAKSLNGYQLPIAMEVRRGRYLQSFKKPTPLMPNKPTEWPISLRDRDHVFLKGHRVMVQVQSTWFPAIDRNPQQFVPSIYDAKTTDFVKATQRVYATPGMTSRIVLPVLPE
jgi:putative CocE/NonD family hydrolase